MSKKGWFEDGVFIQPPFMKFLPGIGISQFTLYGNCSGRRPEFTEAAPLELAQNLYDQFVQKLSKTLNQKVPTGVFGELMEVSLINDGPVTFLVER